MHNCNCEQLQFEKVLKNEHYYKKAIFTYTCWPRGGNPGSGRMGWGGVGVGGWLQVSETYPNPPPPPYRHVRVAAVNYSEVYYTRVIQSFACLMVNTYHNSQKMSEVYSQYFSFHPLLGMPLSFYAHILCWASISSPDRQWVWGGRRSFTGIRLHSVVLFPLVTFPYTVV
jgi:hypothetical protein